MARFAPFMTMVAVAALGGGMLYVNMTQAAPEPAAAPTQEAAAQAPVVAERAYTGRTAGNEVMVAVTVKDGRAVGFVSDGEEVGSWMQGTLTGDRLVLAGAGAELTGTVTEAASLGSVTMNGVAHPFAAATATAPAGLYAGRVTARGVTTDIGWIVDSAGNATGVATAGGRVRSAPAFDPAEPGAVRLSGAPVDVRPISGADQVVAP